MTLDADEYNALELHGDRVTPHHLTSLAELWQYEHGLDDDGKFGPDTKKSVESEWATRTVLTSELSLGAVALQYAMAELGRGEDRANNRGPHIARWLAGDGTGRSTGGAWLWCAVLCSFVYVQAANHLGRPLGWKTSRGAKDLGRKVLLGGGSKVDIDDVRPGDLIILHRGRNGSRAGHVAIAKRQRADGLVETVEGNVGAFPSKVKELVRDLRTDRLKYVVRPV